MRPGRSTPMRTERSSAPLAAPLAAPFAATLAVSLVATLVACDGTTPPEETCDSGLAEVSVVAFEAEGDSLVLPRVYGGTWVAAAAASGCGTGIGVAPGDVAWASGDTTVVSVLPIQGSMDPEAFIQARGFGTTAVSATIGDSTGELAVQVTRPATEADGFTLIDSAYVEPYTTDVWVHGDHAYSGSQPWSCPDPCPEDGFLYVWRVDADGGLTRIDSMSFGAPKINDVKVSADGAFAVATQERGAEGENGIVILDLADPAAPTVTATHTAGLEHGVHNTWIERIDGRDYVFTVEDGGADDAGVHVIDVTVRAAPVEVALYHAGSSFPHDVYVRDGFAFVSHWDAGLAILDVGNGAYGGAPDNPVEVSRIETAGGNAHNAWYWPDGQVVFVGEEQFPPPERIDEVGVVHVVDVSDMAAPVEVATYGVPGATPHNFWMDEAAGILFVGWYENGLRAIDVTGDLVGDLSTQGRELGHIIPSGHRGAASVWAPQIHNGFIYLADIFNGLWAVRYDG